MPNPNSNKKQTPASQQKASNDANSKTQPHPTKPTATNPSQESMDQPSANASPQHPKDHSDLQSSTTDYHGKRLPDRTGTKQPYQQDFLKEQEQHFKFHIISYNILAQQAIDDNSFLYKNCSKDDLNWQKRKGRLLRELLQQDADILCLQEMQEDHHGNVFGPKLKEHGYDSIYSKRPGNKVDGCCLFYRTNRLKLVQNKTVSFHRSDIPRLSKDNCGLIALFQPITPKATSDHLFCVATTHLLYAPRSGDIKLAQTQYFLAEIDRLAKRDPSTKSCYPVILCGDLNSQPASPLMEFLLTGSIKYDNYCCLEISGQTPGALISKQSAPKMPSTELLPSSFVTSDCRFATATAESASHAHAQQGSPATLTHDKRFKSAYDLREPSGVTSYIGEASHLIDYILYTQENKGPHRLNLLSSLDLHKLHHMDGIQLPNHQFPSDHFLISAKFALKL